MLTYLSHLKGYFGPFRLFDSYLILIGLGLFISGILTWILLPVLQKHLPRDMGREYAVDSEKSKSKPTGAGIIMFLVTCFTAFLVIQPDRKIYEILGCIIAATLTGYLDDCAKEPWGEWKKGLCDLLIAIATGCVLCQMETIDIWLPLVKNAITISPILFICITTPILWLMINVTNCTDGVDGLVGTLSLISLLALGGLLYIVVGHKDVATYLLIPHNPEGATWAALVFSAVGAVSGYLWYNAEPSSLLMGDAGSRALGLTVGISILVTGNPVMIIVVAPIIFLNGGGGLVKLLILRFCKRLNIPTEKDKAGKMMIMLHKVRFPLHDHYKTHNNWSNAQILMRFTLLHALLLLLLISLMIKMR
ncbi:MAG: phospho-N-acetylmuramoyl-pentapeptide-transferase [Verrucomicrobiota bacterium]|nr:phospho-N-acetylmuramoyl-pentapeptide-transferase [Verrucomicrobiota bacterium]